MAFRRSFGYDTDYYQNSVSSDPYEHRDVIKSYFSSDNSRNSNQYLQAPNTHPYSDYNNSLVSRVNSEYLPPNNESHLDNYQVPQNLYQKNLNYDDYESKNEPVSKRYKPLYQTSVGENFSNSKHVRNLNQPGKSSSDKFKNVQIKSQTLADLAKNGVAPKSGSNGFHCYFCDAFCNSLITAYSHIESPKHKRHEQEPNEKLQGLDAKFACKISKISIDILKARKDELKKVSEEDKSKYIDHLVRLKDGKGVDAYICELCNVQLSSLKVITGHIACNRHLTNYEAHKAGLELQEEAKLKSGVIEDKCFSLSDQLKLVKAPVIGLKDLIEYIDPESGDMPLYECTLCNVFNNSATVITHIVGFKHRVNYLNKVRPKDTDKFTQRSRETMILASSKAKEVEEAEGRGLWTIKKEKPNIPVNISVSPTKKIHLKEVEDFLGSEEYQKKYFFQSFVNFKIETDSEAKKAMEIINFLIEALLQYKVNKFPPEMKQVLIQKLMSEGIKSSILEQNFKEDMSSTSTSNKTSKT